MKAVAHCFARGVKIEPLPISFKLGDDFVVIKGDKTEGEEEGLVLQITRSVDPATLTPPPRDIRDEMGQFLDKRMRPYKERLTEIARLVEGLLGIFYMATPAKFDPERIVVNIHAETPEEEILLRSDKISPGFGNVFSPTPKPFYKWTDNVSAAIPTAIEHIPALTFLTQAMRSQDNNDQEVAFFLYFRIVDGYFSDGASDVEKELLKKAQPLSTYISNEQPVVEAAAAVLRSLQLPSKAHESFEGLLKDIVLIRHKLTHFSGTNANRHHLPGLKFDLNILNQALRRACILILRDKIAERD